MADPQKQPQQRKESIPMVVPVRSNRGNVSIPLGRSAAEGDVLQLKKGPNLVDAEKWEEALKQKSVQDLLRERIQKSRAPEYNPTSGPSIIGRCVLEAGRPVPASAPLAHMDESKAVELVEDAADVFLLRQLLTAETRGVVRKAIEERIDWLNDPAKQASLKDAGAGEASSKAQITME